MNNTNESDSSEWLSRNKNPLKRDRRSYDSNWGVYEARSGLLHRAIVNVNVDAILVQGDRVGVAHDEQRGRETKMKLTAGNSNSNQQRRQRGDGNGNAATTTNISTSNPNPYQQHSIHQGHSNFNHSHSSHSSSLLPPALLSSLSLANANPPAITVQLPPDLQSTLNHEQCTVVRHILSGHSVFFTGPAGSGKSHILQTLLRANAAGCSCFDSPRNIVLTATTGVAACSIRGTTIHSFSGVNSTSSEAECVRRIMGNDYVKKRWRECQVLVIDEVSMMGSGFLDKLNFVAKRVRNDR
jgi:hypothetical protein